MHELVIFFPIVALANWQVVEIWRHGSLFEGWRAYTQAHPGRLCQLLDCMFCLSNWTSLCLAVPVFLCATSGQLTLTWVLLTPYAFAAARASNWLNDCWYSQCRTPKGVLAKPETENKENSGG
jgi:hypothetical protein